MKTNICQKASVAIAGLILLCQTTKAQDFQNLDFEGSYESVNQTIPGWTASWTSFAGVPENVILGPSQYVALDSNGIYLCTENGNSFSPIDGTQSLFMYKGSQQIDAPMFISQFGTVPLGSQSITLLANDSWGSPNGAAPLTVSFNGTDLNLTPLSDAFGETVEYAASISQFAGQTGTLSIAVNGFTASQYPNAPGEGWAEIDDIQFSTATVPESRAFPIAAAGICLGLICFRRGRALA